MTLETLLIIVLILGFWAITLGVLLAIVLGYQETKWRFDQWIYARRDKRKRGYVHVHHRR